jgi:hypothetical protein
MCELPPRRAPGSTLPKRALCAEMFCKRVVPMVCTLAMMLPPGLVLALTSCVHTLRPAACLTANHVSLPHHPSHVRPTLLTAAAALCSSTATRLSIEMPMPAQEGAYSRLSIVHDEGEDWEFKYEVPDRCLLGD